MTRQTIFRSLAVFSLLLFFRGASIAQIPEGATGPEAGQQLAAQMRTMRPSEQGQWHGRLKITHHHKTTTIPISGGTSTDGSGWTVTYNVGPSESTGEQKLTVHFSADGPNRYVFQQAPAPGAPLGPPQELSGAAANIPIGGSDFWVSDLGMDFYHWPQQERLPGERHGGELCYALRSVNPNPEPGGYSAVKTWIEKESGAPLEAIADAPDGSQLKDFKIGSVRKVNGHWEVKDIEMINIPDHSQTHIIFDLDKS